jgi:peptidoglycan hydrolase-like protein with peptidoglycan-binding domain
MASRRKALIGVTIVALVSIGVGYAAAAQMSSPADEAARAQPPDAGPVTAALEQRALSSQVVVRGDTVFDGSVSVRIETSGLDTPPIVTGEPPAVGTSIEEGGVVLEIAGRPVIALDGALPTYRDLRPGSHGPDVAQLEAAMQRLGIDVGTADDVYDAATSVAVAQLFDRVGYEAPQPTAEETARLTAAHEAVVAANEQLNQAKAALHDAQIGPTQSEQLAADSDVNSAQRSLNAAQTGGDATEIAAAAEQLQIAIARRAEQLAPNDTTEQTAAVTSAQARLDAANAELWISTQAANTSLPASELVFIPTLPRRVDTMDLVRGAVLDGPAMTVSGATVVVSASVEAVDRPLVAVGMPAVIGAVDGDIDGTVESIEPQANGGAVATISLTDPTTEQVDAIKGLNVQVMIPIAATDGEVLCAPLAALSAGPGGESRVELQHADGTSELVEVTLGLSAQGYAEISSSTKSLSAGDLVVVGR